jgi:hypothetical protein
MGVADIISKLRPFAANLAYLCHDYSGWNQNFINETQILPEFGVFRYCEQIARSQVPSYCNLFGHVEERRFSAASIRNDAFTRR